MDIPMVTEKLKAEHQFILRWISWMEGLAMTDAQTGADASNSQLLKHVENVVGFISDYADAYHHSKEEDVLFRYLAHPGVLTECNPLPVMLSEHAAARTILRQMQYAASLADVGGLIEQVRLYAGLLKQHIFKEDNILYQMAEQGLTMSMKQQILAEYSAIDGDRQNIELERHYRTLLNSMD